AFRQRKALSQGSNPQRRTAREKHGHWVRVKSNHDGFRAQLACFFNSRINQFLMPAMHAVEDTNGDCTVVYVFRDCCCSVPNIHALHARSFACRLDYGLMTDSGLVVVDKPAGMTSHDVVSRVRREFGTRKVGHAGTLDPMATGVLILGIERGTKFLAHMVTATKAYNATISLGASTTTDDFEGEIISQTSAAHITDAEILSAIANLTGDI